MFQIYLLEIRNHHVNDLPLNCAYAGPKCNNSVIIIP